MADLLSPCLIGLETSQTVASFFNTFLCPFSRAFGISSLPAVTGAQLFYFTIATGTLAAVYLRTQSFAYTAVVMLVCGTALMSVFPHMVVQIALGMAALALAGVFVKMFTEKQ